MERSINLRRPRFVVLVVALVVALTLSGFTPADAATMSLTTAQPSVSGTRAVGFTLTAQPGHWTAGTAFTYQWFAAGARVAGATRKTFTPTRAQLGFSMAVKVTGHRAGYTDASRLSPGTARIAMTAVPTITGSRTVGATQKGKTITVRVTGVKTTSRAASGPRPEPRRRTGRDGASTVSTAPVRTAPTPSSTSGCRTARSLPTRPPRRTA